MQNLRAFLTPASLLSAGKAVLVVAAVTAVLLIIGRPTVGEAVIALLLLVPVGWSTTRWGPLAGLAAGATAALAFDFFFIPPYYTLNIGSLEGWLVFVIFLAVAVVMVDRISSGLRRALASERDATFMYELSAALAGAQSQSAVAHNLARQLQLMFQAPLVQVVIQAEGQPPSVVAAEPAGQTPDSAADRVLPILNNWGLAGSIQIWGGPVELPPAQGRLLQNFASQAGQALERARLAETSALPTEHGLPLKTAVQPN